MHQRFLHAGIILKKQSREWRQIAGSLKTDYETNAILRGFSPAAIQVRYNISIS